MKGYTLGLDIGANSAGWAMVSDEPKLNEQNIITGVRVFPEGTDRDKGKEESRNEQRRKSRQARRQHDRRSRRKKKLRHILIEAGINTERLNKCIISENPYELRKKALDEKMTEDQFSRALLHLVQRRGFRSSLKTQGAKKKEEEGMKAEISALEKEISNAGARTLGEHFYNLLTTGNRVRARHTNRKMYEDEFEKIWSKQSSYNPQFWNDDLKKKVYEAIFFQRPLKSQKHLIGECELEPGEKRCMRASWFAQQARVFQEVNNLRILTRLKGERLLSNEERENLVQKLMTQISPLKVDVIKSKILKLAEIENLNYEKTERDKMAGNIIEAKLRKIFKDDFQNKSEWLRETVWESLINDDPDEFKEKALNGWKLTEDQVEALYKIERPNGYANYSIKALKKLIPHLEKGMSIYEAKIAAGYSDKELETKGFLPPIHTDDFRNPVVTRALSETRKVVNQIIRENSLPSKIIVEMARETKGTIRSRDDLNKKMRQQETYHQKIAQELQSNGIPVNHDTIEKYKLWDECRNECPYTGKPIAIHQLFGANCEFDVEHILPYEKSLDDSYMNKTLCHRTENQKKHSRTPFEAYNGSPQYEEILLRVKHSQMPYEKKKRFSMEEIPEDFTERHLRDTSYIAKAVVNYLKQLGVPVETTRGAITRELRWQWGIDSIISENGKERNDHREHAIDAIVIAFTTRTHIKWLGKKYLFKQGEIFPSPWEENGIDRSAFRKIVSDVILNINVSHRPQRKISGQLNEETNYGKFGDGDSYAYRVPLEGITPSKVGKIIDPVVREIVSKRLIEHGIKPGEGSKSVPAAVFQNELRMKTKDGKPGPLIKTVRITATLGNPIPIKNEKGNIYRFVKSGVNHHVCIYEYTDEKGKLWRCKDFVSRFEATRRLLAKEPVVRRQHPEFPKAKFLMSLSINDMARIRNSDNSEELFRVQKISNIESQEGIYIVFRKHYAATIDKAETEKRLTSLSVDKFKVRKVYTDILGRLHPAND